MVLYARNVIKNNILYQKKYVLGVEKQEFFQQKHYAVRVETNKGLKMI
jgi:hypothetical protein